MPGKFKYGEEVHNFIVDNVKGNTVNEIIKLVYEKFGITFTVKEMRLYKQKYKLKSGLTFRYSDEFRNFIIENVKGISAEELARRVNERFGTDYSVERISNYKCNHKLKSDTTYDGHKHRIFTDEIEKFIRENATGMWAKDLTELVNKTFGTSYDVDQIQRFKSTNHIVSGLEGYQKGNVPPNKGKKMSKELYAKCAPTMFKKGNIPPKTRPIGSERVDRDGYTFIKTSESKIWTPKAVYIWEQHYGKVPKGSKIIFIDRNKQNFDIENLACVTSGELAQLNLNHRISEFPDVTKAGIALEKYKSAVRNLSKGVKDVKCNKR